MFNYFFILILAFNSFGLQHQPLPTGYSVGDAVKDFRLKNVDGKMVSLSDYRKAKGFIVLFTGNHCAYSIIYQSRIIELNKQFASKGYPLIAISSEDASIFYPKPILQFVNGKVESLSFDSAQGGKLDSYENMIKEAQSRKFTFPYLYDETQEVAHELGATRTPQAFVLQKERKQILLRYTGAIDDNAEDSAAVKHHYVVDAINELLEGKSVSVAHTNAIGCQIAWKK